MQAGPQLFWEGVQEGGRPVPPGVPNPVPYEQGGGRPDHRRRFGGRYRGVGGVSQSAAFLQGI